MPAVECCARGLSATVVACVSCIKVSNLFPRQNCLRRVGMRLALDVEFCVALAVHCFRGTAVHRRRTQAQGRAMHHWTCAYS
jgi:hypothetical protein